MTQDPIDPRIIPSRSSITCRTLLSCFVLLAFTLEIHSQVITPDPGFHPRYKELLRVSGKILDANPDAVLYFTSWPELHLVRYDLESKSHTLIATNFAGQAQLVPGGVVMTLSNQSVDNPVVQWDRGELIDLGLGRIPPEYGGNHIVNGRFGVLHIGDGTILRDFVARTNYLFPVGTQARYIDVAQNGSVVFTTRLTGTNSYTNTVFGFHNGELKTVNVNGSPYGPHVQTDGTNYLWSVPADSYLFGSVYLQTPAESIVLDTETHLNDIPPSGAQPNRHAKGSDMNGGWLAFARRLPGQTLFAPWRRSPDGTITQATTFPSFIKALRPDGGLLVTIGGSVMFAPPQGEPKFISPEFYANNFFVSNQLYAHTDSKLFLVDIDGAPFALTSPAFDRANGVFSYNIHASEPGTFTLERSPDFVNWTPVASNTVTNPYPQPFEISSTPGFFRLRKN